MHPRLSLIATAVLLSACGGGGSDTADSGGSTPQPEAITISGKAAGRTILAGRAVQARCRTGTSEAPTDANGHYELRIASGSFPCVLRVDRGTDPALHSLAQSATGAATANITPVTELVVAQLVGTTPATYYGTGFEASSGSAVTAAAVATATTRVVETQAAAGVSVAAAGDPITASLVTAGDTTGAAVNTYGTALAALDTALQAAATPLPALTAAVAAASPAAPATPATTTPSLPPTALLQIAAPNCAELRNGRYRAVYNGEMAPEVITVDASALRFTKADGSSFSLTANGTCRYRTPAGGEVVVSKGGMLVGQAEAAPFRGMVMFPEQTHGQEVLAGTWNILSLDRVEGAARPQLTSMTLTIAADGRATAITYCETVTAGCVTGNRGVDAGFPDITVSVNPAGGFSMRNATDNWTDPLFVYRTGSGERVFVLTSPGNGHLSLAAPAVARTMPPIGRVSETLNLSFVPNATAPFYTAPGGFSDSRNTIVSTDPATASYVRDAVVNFNTGVTVPETVQGNVPRAGYARRVPGPATASDGSARTVGEWVALSLAGTGMSAVAILGNQNLLLSVDKPQ